MNRNGPVIIIEDDADDQLILQEIFNKLSYKNKVLFFDDSEKALAYLNRPDVSPFLILSDINMPKINGFALRSKIQAGTSLGMLAIPFLFYTTACCQQMINDAYNLSVQGFFVKENSITEMEATIVSIMEYWLRCAIPGSFTAGQ
jgi:DNA-binding NarL/FixJ family response regulator